MYLQFLSESSDLCFGVSQLHRQVLVSPHLLLMVHAGRIAARLRAGGATEQAEWTFLFLHQLCYSLQKGQSTVNVQIHTQDTKYADRTELILPPDECPSVPAGVAGVRPCSSLLLPFHPGAPHWTPTTADPARSPGCGSAGKHFELQKIARKSNFLN